MEYVEKILEKLLVQRGISGIEEVREFLSDKPQKTYDPFLLPDLEAGVDFILQAVKQKKKICIYGDYDADGVTSSAILTEFLRNLTDNVICYIPSRFDEGYGLNAEAVKKIRKVGAEVLVTVDCGSVSFEEVELAKELGMEVLVTDHHSIADVQADCLLINPKRSDSIYPFPDLAGCGVVFKLIQGIQKKEELPKAWINRALDLAAVGTIGDVVPLLDENRTIVKHGMHILSRGLRTGLVSLMNAISIDRTKLKSDQIAFGIVPHINAAGRMGDARIAVKLMNEQDPVRTEEQTGQLVAYNKQRKKIQEEAYEDCCSIVDEHLAELIFFLVFSEHVHEGIAGIVAGKLKDRYERPAALVTPSGEYLKGTSRSIPGVHLYQLLKAHEDLFLRFGGHEGACGFFMEKENFTRLAQLLEEDMKQKLARNPHLFERKDAVDLTLQGSQITLELAERLECLAPFGNKNPKPLFLLEQAKIARQKPMGDGRHIRFAAICPDGAEVECVLFQKARELSEKLYGEKTVDLIGAVDFQEWRGKKSVQFTVGSVI